MADSPVTHDEESLGKIKEEMSLDDEDLHMKEEAFEESLVSAQQDEQDGDDDSTSNIREKHENDSEDDAEVSRGSAALEDESKPEEEEEQEQEEPNLPGESVQEKDIDDVLFKLKRYKKPTSDKANPSSKSAPKVRPPKHRLEGNSEQNADRGNKRVKSNSVDPDADDDFIEQDELADGQDEEPAGSDADDANLDPEARRRKILKKRLQQHNAKPKKKSRKANDESLDAFQDDMINRLREEMRQAAIADAECIKNSQPAINKLKMLPQVSSVLKKGSLADTILDNNLLESIRIWLEPLPDASLPAYQIQKELFEALEALPIKTIHLRESGLGRVVLFYKQSKRPQLNIKRIVDRLMGNWTRPIMGRSDNYRDKIIRTSNYNVQDDDAYRRRGANGSSQSQVKQSSDLAAVNAMRRNRAFIPTNKPVYYEVAPKSVVVNPNAQGKSAVNESYKRMTNRLLGKKKPGSKKSGVSLEGR